MQAYKFKVGDKVKVIGDCTKCDNQLCMFIGNIGTITYVSINKKIYVDRFRNTNKWCSGFDPKNLELVNKPKIKQYGIVSFLEKMEKK